MKRATVYLRQGVIYLHASSATTDGVWILTQPCLRLVEGCEDSELGEQTLLTLDASQEGIPHPKEWRGLLDPLLRLANVKSWNAFARRASCVEVKDESAVLSVVRTENLGPEHGFRDVPGGAHVIEKRTPEEVGVQVRKALSIASAK